MAGRTIYRLLTPYFHSLHIMAIMSPSMVGAKEKVTAYLTSLVTWTASLMAGMEVLAP